MANYSMSKPCDNCPFRTDVRPYLTKTRVTEIERSLFTSEFPCHKTIDHDEDGQGHENERSAHCAGALILLEKLNRPSQMMRICERLGMYDRSKLDMNAPVFDSFSEMRKAMSERKRVATK